MHQLYNFNMAFLPQTVSALLIIVSLYIVQKLYLRNARHRVILRAGCEPVSQYPHKDRLFGSDLHKIQAEGTTKGHVLGMRWKLYSSHGKTFASNWNGQLVLNTMDKDNIETVLGISNKSFIMSPLRNRIAKPLLGKGLLTSDGKTWQHIRSLTASVLSISQAVDLPSLEEHFQKLLKHIPKDGSTIDVQPLFKRLSADQGTELILGESINSLTTNDSPQSQKVSDFLSLFERILRVMGARLRLGHLRFFARGLDLQWKRDCKEAYALLDSFIDRSIERRQKVTSEGTARSKYCLIDKYLDVTSDREEIKTQLINVFLAGRDQFGISLSLLMFALARNPNVWKKICEEARTSPSPPAVEQVKALVYTKNVVFEGFRLYSPILRAIRHCDEDVVLPRGGGKSGTAPILVTRGTQVEMDIGNLHSDPDIWGLDAAEFRPERWEGRPSPGWDYIPFLGGRRYCPAKELVLTQMMYVVIRLAQEFQTLENRDDVVELVDDIRNVRQSRNGVLVAFR